MERSQILLLVVTPVLGYFLYILLKKSLQDDEESSDSVPPRSRSAGSKKRGESPAKGATGSAGGGTSRVRAEEVSKQNTLEVRVPRRHVGVVIGSQGATIKQIQELTGTRISFKDDVGPDNPERVLVIRGPTGACQQAEYQVKSLLTQQPVERTEQILVPDRAVGRIIGRGGETIRYLTLVSHAKIKVSKAEARPDKKRIIEITGTPVAIENAKALIEEKLSEEEALMARQAVHAAHRQQRPRKQVHGGHKLKFPPSHTTTTATTEKTTPDVNGAYGQQQQLPGPIDAFQQLPGAHGEMRAGKPASEAAGPQYSTADVHTREGEHITPTHEQVTHTTPTTSTPTTATTTADGAVQKHSQHTARQQLPPEAIPPAPSEDYLQVYVSAVENVSHFWVQALGSQARRLDRLIEEMSTIYTQQTISSEASYSIGDVVAAPFPYDGSWYRARVEGYNDDGTLDLYYVDFGDSADVEIDKVKPLRTQFLSLPFQAFECYLADIEPTGSGWTEEAIELFEELTYTARWKVIMARTLNYTQSDDKSIPCVELIDTNGPEDVNIAKTLVERGHAQWVRGRGETRPTTPPRTEVEST